MNMSENERFHELAHKALAKKAAPAEERELRALIAENPKLKEEMAQMGGEAAVLREVLPMIEDLREGSMEMSRSLMDRLRTEVGEVLEANRKGELSDLLGGLEAWASRQAGAGRTEVTGLVAFLRASLLESSGEARAAEAAMLRVPQMGYAAPRLKEEVESRAREAAASREAELLRRIRSLEGRLSQAEEMTRGCRDEMRSLLELLSSERSIGFERGEQSPSPLPKPQD